MAFANLDIRDFLGGEPTGDDYTLEVRDFAKALRDPLTLKGRDGKWAAGDYVLSDTVTFEDVKGFQIFTGGDQTRFLWKGPPDKPMFRLFNVSRCRFGPFCVQVSGNGADPVLHSVFWSETKGGHGGVMNTSANRFDGVTADGTKNGFKYGIYYTDETFGLDHNNDLGIHDGCGFSNFTEAAFYLGHSQSKQHTFLNRAGGAPNASRGKYGVHVKHGSFFWLGCGATGMTGADFFFENYAQGDMIQIVGHESELSARLLEMRGEEGVGRAIKLQGVRYDPQHCLHPDGYGMIFTRNGPISIDFCAFGASSRLLLGNRHNPVKASIRNSGFTRNLVGDPDYNSPWDFYTAPGGALDTGNNDFGNERGIPQDLSRLRDGVHFIRAFPGGVFYTANTRPTRITSIYNGFPRQRITVEAGDDFTTISRPPHEVTLKRGQSVELVCDGANLWRIATTPVPMAGG